jgi:hypothetical protein
MWAEAVTDRITADAFAVLESAERIELVGLLDSALHLVRTEPASANGSS